jgi:hypothetical protein
MVGATRPNWQKSLWLALVILVISLLAPAAAMAQNTCIEPNPVSFASKTGTPQIFLVGGGVNTDGHGNECDIYDLALYQTNGANEENGNSFTTFTATSANHVPVTFTYMACNADTGGGPNTGGCLPDGSSSLNTYYQLSLGSTSETTDTVTVYYDPTSSGTPTSALVITLNIDQTAETTTTVASSLNPATSGQSETFTATVDSTSTVSESTVAFTNNSSTIAGCGAQAVDASGQATCTVALAAGSHSIVATYAADANFATSSSLTLTQTVNPAVTAAQSTPSASLTESTSAGGGFIPVTGGGGTVPLSYGISPTLPAGLNFNTSTGRITGTATATHAASSFTVTVTDANSQTAQNSFSLTVNPPAAASQSIASEALTQGHAATSFAPVTGSGGTSPLTYGISPGLPNGLSLSPANGAITGTPTVTLAATGFTVTVTDANGSPATNSFTLTVNAAVTATQSVASKGLTQNHVATSFTPVTGGSGTGSLSFGVSPPLPTGLSLATSTGAITGTPSVTSPATTYTVTVTDQNSATATNTFVLTVNTAVSATQSVASKTLTQSHAAASFTPVTGSGGTSPLSYGISPPLPTGLGLDPTSGGITGTPSVTSAAVTYTVTVTDLNSATATNTFSLTVNTAVTATQSVASQTLTQNHAATSFTPVTGGGGTGTLSYGISPPLPTGLGLATSTGAITGTASVTLAATSFTVTVTDANGATASTSFTLTVNTAVTASVAIASKSLTQNQASASFTPVTGGGGTAR